MGEYQGGSSVADLPAPPLSGARGRAPAIGIAGFVLSIIGLALPPLGVAGLVLAHLGLREARRFSLPRRLCLAGVIIGILACVVWLAMLIEYLLAS
jgi:hypothetical protein